MFDLKVGSIVGIIAFFLSFLLSLITRSTMPMLLVRPLIFGVLFFVLCNVIKVIVSRLLPELMEIDGAGGSSDFFAGTRVNIMEGDYSDMSHGQMASEKVVDGARPDESDEELGDISQLAQKTAAARAAARVNIDAVSMEEENFPTGIDHSAIDNYNSNVGNDDFFNLDSDLFFTPKNSPDSVLGQRQKGPEPNVGFQGGQAAKPAPPSNPGDFPETEDSLLDLDSISGTFAPVSASGDTGTTEYVVSAPYRKPSSSKAPEWAGDFNAKDIASGLRTVLNKDKEG